MADILFKCNKCASLLTCEVSAVDKSLPCSGCGQTVRVPRPDISFPCEHCQAPLCAPRNAADTAFSCPQCETEVVVPSRTAKNLAVRRSPASLAGKTPEEEASSTASQSAPPPANHQCPKCGGPVAPAAIICLHCGINLKTGRKPGQSSFPLGSAIKNFLSAIALPLMLVGMAAGGWYYWDYRKQEEVRVQAEQQRAAEAAKAEKLRLEKAQKEQQRLAELAKAAAQRQANIEHCRMLYCNATKIALFDALTLLSAESTQRIAIDPDAVDTMVRIQVETSALPAANDTAALTEFLTRYHLIIRKCPLANKGGRFVYLVTTEQIWAYNQAAWLLQANQLDQAYQVLNNTKADSSAFGMHCQNLRSLLASMANDRDELTKLARQVADATESCRLNFISANMANRAEENKMHTVGRSAAGMSASARYEKSLNDFNDATQLMSHFVKKMALNNKAIWMRHLEAHNAQLYTESLALLNVMIANFNTLEGLCNNMNKVGQMMAAPQQQAGSSTAGQKSPTSLYDQMKLGDALAAITTALGDIPPFLLDRQRALRDSVRFSSDRLTAIFAQKNPTIDIADSLKFANEAFASDRGNLMARAAVGYFRVQWQAKAASEILSNNAIQDSARYEELAREFRENRKEEALRITLELAGRTNSTLRVDTSETKVGTATGLCVWNAKGELFPLSARVTPILPHSEVESNADTYWGKIETLVRDRLAHMPIAFGDYGYKDVYVCMSAIEVYTWLTITTTNKAPALQVEFQDLEFGKAGDSAGVTMAVAANSSITQRRVRRDVAMSGSFRSDGAVLPVGSVFEKVDGAVAAPQIEIVLLPKGNEADCMLIPIDKLCRIVIASGDDVQPFIRYATDASYNQASLASLRKAQTLILGGKLDLAESLLVEVATDCPEIYTARRLLELLSFWKKTGRTGYRYNAEWPAASDTPAFTPPPPAPPRTAEPAASAPTTAPQSTAPATPPPPNPTLKKAGAISHGSTPHRLGE